MQRTGRRVIRRYLTAFWNPFNLIFLWLLASLHLYSYYDHFSSKPKLVIVTSDPIDHVTKDCPETRPPLARYTYPPPKPHPIVDMYSDYPAFSSHQLLGETSVVIQYDEIIGSYTGSPSIIRNSDGTLICSFDVKFISDIYTADAWETQIWSSKDDGITWIYQTTIRNFSWGSLFTVNGKIYLLGVGDLNSHIVISRMQSLDKWTKPAVILDKFPNVHTGNVGVLVTQNKVQTCIKNGRRADILVLYAFFQVDDLMKPWRTSNMVEDPLRVHMDVLQSLFHMKNTISEEGVMVPYGPHHAQIIMRANNDQLCGLSSRLLWDLETNELQFFKLSIDPGWAVAHGFVLYDSVSDFYWMVSHYTRDLKRSVANTALFLTTEAYCNVDRSILGLYYNKHLSDAWHFAGFVSYSPDFAHHSTYPFMIQDGDDILFVARSHLGGPLNETTINHGKRVCNGAFKSGHGTANNHNSNMVTFTRVTNFRQYIHPMMWYGERKDNPWSHSPLKDNHT